jgi:hypothetical protein
LLGSVRAEVERGKFFLDGASPGFNHFRRQFIDSVYISIGTGDSGPKSPPSLAEHRFQKILDLLVRVCHGYKYIIFMCRLIRLLWTRLRGRDMVDLRMKESR